jgi:hypothetical protein
MRKIIRLGVLGLILLPVLLSAQIVEFSVAKDTFSYTRLNNPMKINGLVVLFNYGGGNGLSDIPAVCESDSILVIDLKNDNWFMPGNEMKYADACIHHAMKTNNINHYIIGGFSGGGTAVIRYTEQLIERGMTGLMPKGIFVGDPPIDHLEFYKYCEKEMAAECDAPDAWMGKEEAKQIKHDYDSILGSPIEHRVEYIKVSPTTITESDFGNGKLLINMPIRFYHELDPMFYIVERCRSTMNSHLISSSELVNYLYHHGNKKAEIIITQNKGYRTNGMRHPHSWSIIDGKGLIEWYKGIDK